MRPNAKPAPKKRYDVMTAKQVGEKTFFTRVGVGWPHKDGRGINIELEALPIDGRLVVRPYEPRDTSSADADDDVPPPSDADAPGGDQ